MGPGTQVRLSAAASAVRFASDGGLLRCYLESDYGRVAAHTI
jgi:hypothetical protein